MYFKTLDELRGYVEMNETKPSEQLMVLVGYKSADCVQELMNYLNDMGVSFFGGIYAALLVENSSMAEGFIVQRYEPIYSSIVLPYMMRFKQDLKSIEGSTAIVLVDGLSGKMKDLTDTVFYKLGSMVKYIGGGAGFYDMKHRPCIFDNKGIYEDVLYMCIVKGNVEIGVKHGWNKLTGPYTVTRSEGNVLSELDGDNAFEVYKDVIEEIEDFRISREDFFVYAKDHPFGITYEGGDDVFVRDPIYVNDNNEIVCVADIPEGSTTYVLKGDANTLLSSSVQIADYCSGKATDKYAPLLFDCISRAMFLEDKFDEELTNIQNRLKFPVEGALSIGEIASQNNGELIIHNKSTILGLLTVNS